MKAVRDLTMSPAAAQCESEVELSIVMPCLDETVTLAVCMEEAMGLERDGIGADNGSSNGS